ncbi:MAG: FAD-binding oxidoreductase [Planctomycetes bacterium]|nr:FAD-binding oxidoreductase [Planctomycetota bacterium]
MNTIEPILFDLPPIESVFKVSGDALRDSYAAYLADESRLTGSADTIFFPETTPQVAAVITWAVQNRVPLTVSGARTGIAGGAVPRGGAVLSCEKLTATGNVESIRDRYVISAGAGVTIKGLAEKLLYSTSRDNPHNRLFYPPDPTEDTAQLGGTVACNASGARTFLYGPTRLHVHALTVVLPDGETINVGRGGASFAADSRLVFSLAGGPVTLDLPIIPDVPVSKNVAGFYARPGMEAIDLFIGSEGTLGVITEAQLYLMPEPYGRVSAMLFTDAEEAALDIVDALRSDGFPVRPESIEFFGSRSLALLHDKRREEGAASGIPPFPYPSGAAIFTEIPYPDEAGIDEALEALLGLVEETGIPEESTWVGTDPEETTRMKALRHALPETVNSIIGRRRKDIPDIHKIGTDLAVPDAALREFLAIHHRLLGGFEYVVFGHIGNNHLHANILPRDRRELDAARETYSALVAETLRLNGTVAAEHGIGKLKTRYLARMLPGESLSSMKRIKNALDPHGILCPGNIFG